MKAVTKYMCCFKGEYDLALKLAKYAVDTTPSEYLTWAKLTEGNSMTTCVRIRRINKLYQSLYRPQGL